MPNPPLRGLGQVPVAVYSCATSPLLASDAERRARHYADARYWLVAGVWTDDDPSVPLSDRHGWSAVTGALSSGLIRGIVVAAASHVSLDAAQFAALGVLVRDRGGFLTEAIAECPRRTPGQHERRRVLFDAAAGWVPYGRAVPATPW